MKEISISSAEDAEDLDAACEAHRAIDEFESALRWNGIVWWVVLPSVLIPCGFMDWLHEADCGTGVGRFPAFILLLVVGHLLWAETSAWRSICKLLAPPEFTIMRQLGVLRQRSIFLFLGVLEGVDLFTDFVFPFVARACDAELTNKWRIAWGKVPFIGNEESGLLYYLRFWGVALAVALVNVAFSGILALLEMRREEQLRKQNWLVSYRSGTRNGWGQPRVEAEVFFAWARSSTTSLLPSTTVLCEAMAEQRKWAFSTDLTAKDTRAATQARTDVAMGWAMPQDIRRAEVTSQEHYKAVKDQRERYHTHALFFKVFLGNVLPLWLQSSYLALTFDELSNLAHQQVVVSMLLSGIIVLVRCTRMSGRMGRPGLAIFALVAAFLSWTAAKVYYAYHCPDHVWNLTSGCVELHQDRQERGGRP